MQVEGPPDAFVASSAHPELVDKVVEWERKAAQQYAEDGDADGWDSDASEPETAEQRYIRVRPPSLSALQQWPFPMRGARSELGPLRLALRMWTTPAELLGTGAEQRQAGLPGCGGDISWAAGAPGGACG